MTSSSEVYLKIDCTGPKISYNIQNTADTWSFVTVLFQHTFASSSKLVVALDSFLTHLRAHCKYWLQCPYYACLFSQSTALQFQCKLLLLWVGWELNLLGSLDASLTFISFSRKLRKGNSLPLWRFWSGLSHQSWWSARQKALLTLLLPSCTQMCIKSSKTFFPMAGIEISSDLPSWFSLKQGLLSQFCIVVSKRLEMQGSKSILSLDMHVRINTACKSFKSTHRSRSWLPLVLLTWCSSEPASFPRLALLWAWLDPFPNWHYFGLGSYPRSSGSLKCSDIS